MVEIVMVEYFWVDFYEEVWKIKWWLVILIKISCVFLLVIKLYCINVIFKVFLIIIEKLL